MSHTKILLPKLKRSKELRSNGFLHSNGSENSSNNSVIEAVLEEDRLSMQKGILCYFKSEHKKGLLAHVAFKLMDLFFEVLDSIQSSTKDGKTGLALQLHPHLDFKEGRMAFLLTAEETILQPAIATVHKMARHIKAIRTQQLPQSYFLAQWTAPYQALFKALQNFRQELLFEDLETDEELLSLSYSEMDQMLTILANQAQTKKKQTFNGIITGSSQQRGLIEFNVNTKNWNGIRTQKEIPVPIACKADKALIQWASQHIQQNISLVLWKTANAFGELQYELIELSIHTVKGPVKKRAVHTGTRGGQFYLSYQGKRIYLGKSKSTKS